MRRRRGEEEKPPNSFKQASFYDPSLPPSLSPLYGNSLNVKLDEDASLLIVRSCSDRSHTTEFVGYETAAPLLRPFLWKPWFCSPLQLSSEFICTRVDHHPY